MSKKSGSRDATSSVGGAKNGFTFTDALETHHLSGMEEHAKKLEASVSGLTKSIERAGISDEAKEINEVLGTLDSPTDNDKKYIEALVKKQPMTLSAGRDLSEGFDKSEDYSKVSALQLELQASGYDMDKRLKIFNQIYPEGSTQRLGYDRMENILPIEVTVRKVVGDGKATATATRDDKRVLKDCITNLIADDPKLEKIVKKHLGKIIRKAFADNQIKVESGIAQRFSDLMRDDTKLKEVEEKLEAKGINLKDFVAKMKEKAGQSAASVSTSTTEHSTPSLKPSTPVHSAASPAKGGGGHSR